MPYHLSPKKRLRRDSKRNLLNRSRIKALKTILKKAYLNINDPEYIIKAQKVSSMAASRGVLHKNTASRKISRLMKKAHQKKSVN